MFTGLIENTGTIDRIDRGAEGASITVKTASDFLKDVENGESIAINGVCQTVVSFTADTFTVFAVPETLAVTAFSDIQPEDRVNLEKALTLNKKLGGHIVQGHVEGTAEVLSVEQHEDYADITLMYRSEYLVPKGSIALDGISLTIHESDRDSFRVQIIPETMQRTNILNWQKGSRINIETDYLIKAIDHIERYRKQSS